MAPKWNRLHADEHIRGRYWRLTRPLIAGIVSALVLTLASLTGIGVTFAASGSQTAPAAVPVPTALRQPIAIAALSCPTLTPARLAGQLMAASGFDPAATAVNGGKGIAGLSDAAWATWKPAPDATRTDAASNVLALAHQMCDLVGEVRAAKVPGDLWRNALAAYRSGTAAVVKARGVPSTAAEYVKIVAAYGIGYAEQGLSPSPSPSRSIVKAVAGTGFGPVRAVPAVDLPLVLAAGKKCPTITPSRVAGQLMAASGFQANLLGVTGAQGVAQFLPEIWAQYAPSKSTTPWDPTAAISALGTAMCDLVAQLSALGGDPYQLALAAFWWGPTAVRQAGTAPGSVGIGDFVQAAQSYALAYATNPSLSAGLLVSDASPSSPPAPVPSTPAQPSPQPTATASQWTTVTVSATTVLVRGQSVQSNRTRLVMQDDGNLAIYDESGQQRWNSGTAADGGFRAVFQADGNLVVYDKDWNGLWTSNTAGRVGAELVLEADGDVCVVYQGAVIWSANTAR